MDEAIDAQPGWEHIPPELAAVARRAGITAAELDAFRDDPANQDTGLPDLDEHEWDRILAPVPDGWAEDDSAWIIAGGPPRGTLPVAEPAAEPDADDRQRVLLRLGALRPATHSAPTHSAPTHARSDGEEPCHRAESDMRRAPDLRPNGSAAVDHGASGPPSPRRDRQPTAGPLPRTRSAGEVRRPTPRATRATLRGGPPTRACRSTSGSSCRRAARRGPLLLTATSSGTTPSTEGPATVRMAPQARAPPLLSFRNSADAPAHPIDARSPAVRKT